VIVPLFIASEAFVPPAFLPIATNTFNSSGDVEFNVIVPLFVNVLPLFTPKMYFCLTKFVEAATFGVAPSWIVFPFSTVISESYIETLFNLFVPTDKSIFSSIFTSAPFNVT
jgi:hypothetical protein